MFVQAAGSLVSDKLPKLGRASSFVSLAAQMIHGEMVDVIMAMTMRKSMLRKDV